MCNTFVSCFSYFERRVFNEICCIIDIYNNHAHKHHTSMPHNTKILFSLFPLLKISFIKKLHNRNHFSNPKINVHLFEGIREKEGVKLNTKLFPNFKPFFYSVPKTKIPDWKSDSIPRNTKSIRKSCVLVMSFNTRLLVILFDSINFGCHKLSIIMCGRIGYLPDEKKVGNKILNYKCLT